MNETKLKDDVNYIAKKSVELFEKNAFLPVVIICYKKDLDKKKTLSIIPMTKNMMEKRQETMYTIGKFAFDKFRKDGRIESVITTSEAWMSVINTKKESDKNKKLLSGEMKPSEDPKKIEIVMISGMNEYGEIEALIYKITKDRKLEEIKSIKTGFESALLSRFWDGFQEKLKL